MKKNYDRQSRKELIKILNKRDERIEKLRNEKCQLERRLLAYENAHTPPSKQLYKKKIIGKKITGKLGAPKGHPKYSRKEPSPDKTIVYEKVDEIYQDRELAFLGEKIVYEEEIPEPQPVFVIKHVIYYYLDIGSKEIIYAKNNAPKSCFGKNAHTHVTLLKFEDRLPLRKVASSLKRHYKIEITNTGIYGITKRVARKLGNPYYDIIKIIRTSDILYIDETKYKLNGQTWWLWVFVSENAVLFVIRKSRNEKVIEEILGKDYKGKIVSDGWKAYKKFAKFLQRCWAHILRECDKLEEKYKNFKHYNKKVHELFEEICKIREKPPTLDKRKKLQKEMTKRIENIARNMLSDYRFRKLGGKILNGLDAWFTCIIFTEIEPTNNFAEQALRELIIQRKIMGGLRSRDGAIILERLSTCITTWKKQDKPLFETLKNYM